jgi:hypothetical protein
MYLSLRQHPTLLRICLKQSSTQTRVSLVLMQSNILSHNQTKFIAKRLRSSMSRRVVALSNMRNRHLTTALEVVQALFDGRSASPLNESPAFEPRREGASPSWTMRPRWIMPRTAFHVRWGLRLQAGNKTSKQILIRRVVVHSESIAYEMA